MSGLSLSRGAALPVVLLVLLCTCAAAQDKGGQPAVAANGAGARLVLSASTFGGSPQYQSWPLVLELTLWREPPTEGATAPPPLTIKAKQGAWCEALVVTVKDGTGAAVQWSLHLVKQDDAGLTLAADGGATVEWWLSPEETQALPEGDYRISVAFDPERVDGLPTGDDAPRGDDCRLQVAKEPAPLDADTTAGKLYQQAWFCIVRDDKAGADGNVAKLMAADPESIGGRRLKAALLVRDGKASEALTLLDEALDIYDRKYPKACPPAGLLAARAQIAGTLKPATVKPDK